LYEHLDICNELGRIVWAGSARELGQGVKIVTRIEVFADVTCPFAHVGLRKVVGLLAGSDQDVEIVVRAWPLEWVNGVVLESDGVAVKARALTDQLGVADFDGFDPSAWPTTTVPALNLVAAAYDRGLSDGLSMSLRLRAALFADGLNIGQPDVLAGIAAEYGLDHWVYATEPSAQVQLDYDEGRQRGVRGSPDFWVGEAEFFCPALTLGHDDDGALVSDFDPEGLEQFIDQVTAQE